MNDMPRILYLTMDDVKSVGFSDHDFINCVSDIFLQYGQGAADLPVEMNADISPEKKIRVDTGCVEKCSVIGMRWSVGNAGVIILSDGDSGTPRVMMDAFYLSAKCTAATYALTARYFARKDAEVLTLLGLNQQGLYHLHALSQVQKQLKEVRVYSGDGTAANRLAKSIQDDFPFRVEICDTPADALKNTDVIVDAELPGADKPVQIRPGLIPEQGVCIVTGNPGRFPKSTLAVMDKIVADGVRDADSGGGINFYADLGEVSAGKKAGRQNAAENILAVCRGLFIVEIYTGMKMYDAAREKGIGIELAPITW